MRAVSFNFAACANSDSNSDMPCSDFAASLANMAFHSSMETLQSLFTSQHLSSAPAAAAAPSYPKPLHKAINSVLSRSPLQSRSSLRKRLSMRAVSFTFAACANSDSNSDMPCSDFAASLANMAFHSSMETFPSLLTSHDRSSTPAAAAAPWYPKPLHKAINSVLSRYPLQSRSNL